MHKITVWFLAAIATFVLLGQPSHADVTVTMRGSFAFNGVSPTQAQADSLNAALNTVRYYHGSVERFDIRNSSVVVLDRGNSAIAVNTVTKQYRTIDAAN